MKAWQHQLKAAMQHPAAAVFVARLNAEEQAFKSTVGALKYNGKGLVNVPSGLLSSNWMILQGHAGKRVVNEFKRRPNVEWTTEIRMSKAQTVQIESMMSADWKVWCGVRLTSTGASAVLMKMDTTWAVVYEDGSVIRGAVPVLQAKWPQVLKPTKEQQAKIAAAKQPAIKLNSKGGFTMSRYSK